ncbi:MAG: DUF423 domain-containing protein [Flavobacteriaceae bacterium]|nr:DUF423 domain-containing protein [Flavobacteriaceae bacterium]
MDRKIIATAAFLGMTAIILGAFGAHALKNVLSISELNTFETGVKYQMYHALFLLFIGTSKDILNKAKKIIFYTIILGVFLFSVSLYFLAINRLLPFDFSPFGFITPIGGLLFLAVWLWVFVNFYRKNR